MKYDLTSPCANCPFRNDRDPFITAGRAREILTGGQPFTCHKTVDYDKMGDDEDHYPGGERDQHCAGVLIILEHEELPHQMMRIAERLGMYDRRKLKMDAPVYRSIAEAVAAHRKVRR